MVMRCLLWWRQDNETITSRLLLCLHLIICATFCTKFPDRPPTLTKKNKITLHLSFHYHIQISTKVYKIPFFNIKPCAFLTHKMICLNLVKSPPNNMPSMKSTREIAPFRDLNYCRIGQWEAFVLTFWPMRGQRIE